MANLTEKSTALFAQLSEFEQKIGRLAQAMQIRLDDYHIDHLALRTHHVEMAQRWLAALSTRGRILSENKINGRPIYLIELQKPIVFGGQAVSVIELPFPKDKIYPQEGWEHIEIVMPLSANESALAWRERIMTQFLWNKQPHLAVKSNKPKAVGERLPNPTIAVTLADQTENHVCIKVHPYPIKRIAGG